MSVWVAFQSMKQGRQSAFGPVAYELEAVPRIGELITLPEMRSARVVDVEWRIGVPPTGEGKSAAVVTVYLAP